MHNFREKKNDALEFILELFTVSIGKMYNKRLIDFFRQQYFPYQNYWLLGAPRVHPLHTPNPPKPIKPTYYPPVTHPLREKR